MIKKTLPIVVLFGVLTSYATAGLQVTNAGGGTLALPADANSVTLNLQYLNDTGSDVQISGVSGLTLALSSSFYVGSGTDGPSIDGSNVPTPASGFTPSGTNFFNFGLPNVGAGDAITFGTLQVTIPADFIGEFILASTENLVIGLDDGTGFDDIGVDGFDGTVTVGTGTVVPEPSSFLFLGLVGTGALGVRFFRRREEEVDCEA